VDNILVISIFVGRLPAERRDSARLAGLAFALLARIGMLIGLLSLTRITNPVLLDFSVRDLILITGGLFLLWKAVKEIHHTVENKEAGIGPGMVLGGFAAIISQIVLLDIVFSIDSVITAIGLTDRVWIIVSSVMVSFVAILFFARTIGEFILEHPAIKILALSFLITIGVTIFMEGMHKHVPKGYIYLPMGFALMVELLQMRYENNRKKCLPSAQAS
jgi:predicted tellurium resistance membrane protein TerC